ncbi:type II secretion system protein N [Parasphingopyxis lamellibrachiae]|uniref:Type II secretion system protein N n=1 Tax=Parasphingopyxis lamellibrachiae TaxID=680125 RepID=A0A3D9FDY3_9SPHN|nr:type II secretion system protein N [Parasphingopyxis lamellibrachiae]RED15797.1 type II secretion system protein N (GspN) [Parasphingopyxis lamellibrachiae]
MRIALPMSRAVLFVCIFLLAMLVLIPMQHGLGWLGMDERGIAARETRGSIWNGRLVEAQFGDAAVGDVDARLGFFPLLVGRARIAMARSGSDAGAVGDFRGAMSVSGAEFGLDDMQASLPAALLFAPLPVAGIELEDVTVHFDHGLCSEAEGLVRARLGGNLGGVSLPDMLMGNAQCDEGALLLPLISQSGMEQLEIRIDATGAYAAELRMMAVDDAARERLALAGFVPGANGYALAVQGEL